MKKRKVSIIVPVYNVSGYLDESLRSLEGQTLKNFEVLCVDDGSTDGSAEILELFAARDNRFRIISKENTGYGDSMNVGIAAAEGDYIGILEPDDFMESTCYEKLYAAAKKFKADMVKCNYYSYESGKSMSVLNDDLHIVPYRKVVSKLFEEFMVPPAIWAGLYRRDFLIKNGIRFLTTPGASFQDTGFAFKTALCAERFVSIEDALIYYRTDNDTSSVKDHSKVFCICDEFYGIESFMRKKGIEDMWGIYTRVKMLRYQWNYNRLEGDAKERFERIFRKEMRNHWDAGWIDRRYWSDEDWEKLRCLMM